MEIIRDSNLVLLREIFPQTNKTFQGSYQQRQSCFVNGVVAVFYLITQAKSDSNNFSTFHAFHWEELNYLLA